MCLNFTTALVYPQVLREKPDIIFPTINSRCAFTLACVRACECMCVVQCWHLMSWQFFLKSEVECCVACEWGSYSGIHAPYQADGNHFQMTSHPKYKTYLRSGSLFTCLAISSLLHTNMFCILGVMSSGNDWHLPDSDYCVKTMHAWFNCLHLLAWLLADVYHSWEIHFYGTLTWTV